MTYPGKGETSAMDDMDISRMTGGEPPGEKKSRVGLYIGIGCLTLVLFVGVMGYLGYKGVKGLISGVVEEYTDIEPRALPEVLIGEEDARTVIATVDDFKEAVRRDQPVDPLVLTGDDINLLIHYHPNWKVLKNKVYITIEDDNIRGEVSFPLDDIGGFMKGRYLNGSAVFSVALMDGRLLVFLNAIEVKGKALPEEFMKQLRSENLAKNTNEKGDLDNVLEKLDAILVKGSQLFIVPKSVR
jgi:hypothetical protein